MGQIFINILATTFIYLLLALSISVMYAPMRFFNIAHAITITLGAYFTFFFVVNFSIPLVIATILAVILATSFAIVIEIFIYRPLRHRNTSALYLMIASLGLYYALQNTISLIWGDRNRTFRSNEIKVGIEFLGGYITENQILTIIISIIAFIAVVILLRYNIIGKAIRSVSSNIELSNIFGINSDKILLYSLILGSALGSMAGILISLERDMNPTMGFNLFLFGAVVMIISGIGSYGGLIVSAFLIACLQHLTSYYISSQWADGLTYLLLVVFLIFRPLGISGKRLKKIEI